MVRALVWIYGACVVVLSLAIGAFAAFGYSTNPKGAVVWGGTGTAALVLFCIGIRALGWSRRVDKTTLHGFNRLRIGATLDECVTALGSHGRHMTTSTEEVGGRIIERKQCFWTNKNGSFCEIILEDDRVVAKSQVGLN